MKKLSTEEFIIKSKKIHGEKYDYSVVEYENSQSKIKIICNKHGEFEQLPLNHLKGKGCKKCVIRNKISSNTLLERFNTKHNNKYSYISTNFNLDDDIIIICPIHGNFIQKTRIHLKSGCPKCANNIKLTTEEFIKKSKEIHGEKYNYDRVEYKNMNSKVEILCEKHGLFSQSARDHLSGSICNFCSGIKMNTDIFIMKSNKIHNNVYDYSLTNYKNAKIKIKIICKKHGIFKQIPNNHLNGYGCPNCFKSKGENIIEKHLKCFFVNYKPQYSFTKLRYKKPLHFDFAIFDSNNNLKYLIEYNGEQHYNFRKQFNMTEEEFNEGLKRDKLKQDYCIKNNIPLYIIRYDENITEMLQKIINENETIKQENRV